MENNNNNNNNNIVRETMNEMLVNDNYEFWRATRPFLYDFVVSDMLEWPSLTVEWLPEVVESSDKDYTLQKVILGTHTVNYDPNFLIIGQVKLPIPRDSTNDAEDNLPRSDRLAGGKIEIIQKINHTGEVNRARYMPQNPEVIATKTVSGEIYVFDYSKHPSKPRLDEACNPELRLRGHDTEGFGLAWSKLKQGLLLSGSEDAQICLWDINRIPSYKALDPMQIFKINEAPVSDVKWHVKNEYLFGACGDDSNLHIMDLRSPFINRPTLSIPHQDQLNCLEFNPFNENIVATGSVDSVMTIFDLRKVSSPLHTFNCHRDEVIQIGWSPHNENVLASGCTSRRIMVWDLNRNGMEQSAEDGALEVPPELVFVHGGHARNVSDFSWNPCKEWQIASVSINNMFQIWKMADYIHQ